MLIQAPRLFHTNDTIVRQCAVIPMSKIVASTSHDAYVDAPESEYDGETLTAYDPNDPESIQLARQAIMKHFGLKSIPPLCNEPEPGFFEQLWNALWRW
ncbi:MAG: hypothetical protein IPK82_30190 [Polyangiaceae bacterium]|nr:hypothetical protein [Polyangiaceae bacterium]